MKRATQFTLFATVLIVVSMLVIYAVILADFISHLQAYGLEINISGFVGARHLLVLAIVAVIAYTVSSIIIENVLNPMRQMTSKIKELGEMNFDSPLVIDEDDDELREYAFQFNTMSSKLSRYIEMHKRFVSDASHELATPITIINGHADLLLRRAAPIEGNEIFKDGLSTIKQEIMRMSGLVDSLLLLARSDSGSQNYKFEPTEINNLLEDAVEESRLLAPEFTFEKDFQLTKNNKIVCDEYAIRRVMRILLSNAIKFSSIEREPHITVAATEAHGMLNVSITDNGIGIPPEHLPRIFERFYRVDGSRNRNYGGSGLGLAIAREIILAHGGKIHSASTENGTEISFTI